MSKIILHFVHYKICKFPLSLRHFVAVHDLSVLNYACKCTKNMKLNNIYLCNFAVHRITFIQFTIQIGQICVWHASFEASAD